MRSAARGPRRLLALRACAALLAYFLGLVSTARFCVTALGGWQHVAGWYLVAEALFIPAYVWQARRLALQPAKHEPPTHQPDTVVAAYLRQAKFFQFTESYATPWFNGTPMALIKRDNIMELLSYGFWYRSLQQAHAEGLRPALERMMEGVEAAAGFKLPPGYTPGLTWMSHLWDALPHVYRPLGFYIITELLAWGCHAMMLACGFRRWQSRGLVYYTHGVDAHRGVAGGDADVTLFMHGVGAGPLPYLPFIFKLINRSSGSLVVPVYKHVSMRICARIPTVQELADGAAAFCKQLGAGRMHVVSHSYGTLVASRFVQCHPGQVASLTLIDPVCFAMYMPNLLRNFLYTFPRSGSRIMDAAMWMVSRELHCTATFCRQFYWSNYNLFDCPDRTLVVLSGQDVLCPSHAVASWLEEDTSARVLFHPSMRHASCVLRPAYQDYILEHWGHISRGCRVRPMHGPEPDLRVYDGARYGAASAPAVDTLAAAAAEAGAPGGEEATRPDVQLQGGRRQRCAGLEPFRSDTAATAELVHALEGGPLLSRAPSCCARHQQQEEEEQEEEQPWWMWRLFGEYEDAAGCALESTSGGSQQYVHHGEPRQQQSATPDGILWYTDPSDGSLHVTSAHPDAATVVASAARQLALAATAQQQQALALVRHALSLPPKQQAPAVGGAGVRVQRHGTFHERTIDSCSSLSELVGMEPKRGLRMRSGGSDGCAAEGLGRSRTWHGARVAPLVG